MSSKKEWTGREKLAIVLVGLKGECRISKFCNEHGISQGMYYKMAGLTAYGWCQTI